MLYVCGDERFTMSKVIEECIARMQRACERLEAGRASLRATVERWQPSWENPMRAGLGSEHYILKKWKRRPRSFHTLPDGEVQYGPGRTHTVRTQYLRRDYNSHDVAYLESCASAQRSITADEANRILRTMKPDTSRSKRPPAEADPDPDIRAEYRARPERHLTAEDLARAQFTGRALERELRRMR
jgi:hypothetical protein